LNVNWFESIEEAKARIEDWGRDYNESRPHQALGQRTQFEYVMRMKDLDRSRDIETAGN
jgi:putative transposase